MSNVTQQQPEQNSEEEKKLPVNKKRLVGLFLITLAMIAAWFLLIGYLGWQSGQELLTEQQTEAKIAQLTHQINLSKEDIVQEKYNLATRRLEWILSQEPTNQEAIDLQTAVQEKVAQLSSPVVAATEPPPTEIETAVPLPTPDPEMENDPEATLQHIRRLMATKEWAVAIPAILDFQVEYPSYERQETDTHLYDASISYGIDLLNGENVELGMFYISQAAALGDLSQTVLDYQTWAELYLQGVAFYGANWEASAYYFRDLCLAAPFYQSSCDRLYNVLILFGDQEAATQEWCPAEKLYEEASGYARNSDLSTKLQDAHDACLLATPTPDAPTEPITNTEPITESLPFLLPTITPVLSTPVP